MLNTKHSLTFWENKVIKALLIFIILLLFNNVSAQNQNDSILMTIAGENVFTSEFLNVYKKNNVNNNVLNEQSLKKYLNLYINFRLKVKQAEDLGLDTVKSFMLELKGYRDQLAKPYLVDKAYNEKLLREAYNREKSDIRASHILVKVSRNASPKDTLAAYNKIMKIRKRIINGEDFGEVAAQTSEDASARDRKINNRVVKGNKGDLGYFTVFNMIYPFENAAYNTKVGEVSMPVRTDYGYHILKVTDKIPAMGKVLVAHILLLMPKNGTAEDSLRLKNKAFEIYQKIQKGESFDTLARKYSDDKGSAVKGGLLPWFGVNRMVPEFIKAISEIHKKGEVSKPVLTSYGWHIIKFIDRKPIGTFDEDKSKLKQKLAKNSRSSKSKESFISKIKKEYGFKENIKAKNIFYKLVNDSIFYAKWNYKKDKDLNKILFTLDSKTYTQQDFARYLVANQKKQTRQNIKVYINNMYKKFVNQSCIAYEDSQLENKYPEFKSLVKEYKNGMLLFELMDKKIWSQAIKDTVGLKNYYEKNKNNYMWDRRLDASIFTFKNPENKKLIRKARRYARKGYSNERILKKINKDSVVNLTINTKRFLKNDNKIIDSIKWKKGISDNIKLHDSVVFVVVHKLILPEPKLLNEAKGIITADYQNYLEKQWIKSLRKKYPVVVNKKVLSSIIKKNNL